MAGYVIADVSVQDAAGVARDGAVERAHRRGGVAPCA